MSEYFKTTFPYFFLLGFIGALFQVSWWVLVPVSLALGIYAAHLEDKQDDS